MFYTFFCILQYRTLLKIAIGVIAELLEIKTQITAVQLLLKRLFIRWTINIRLQLMQLSRDDERFSLGLNDFALPNNLSLKPLEEEGHRSLNIKRVFEDGVCPNTTRQSPHQELWNSYFQLVRVVSPRVVFGWLLGNLNKRYDD